MRLPEGQFELVRPMVNWTASRLREARIARGWTQQQLGVNIGNSSVGGTRVCDYESGKNDPKLSTVLRHARALNVDMDKLFIGAPSWRKDEGKPDVVVINRQELEAIIRQSASAEESAIVMAAVDKLMADRSLG